jgi:ClpP class serine protease
VIRLLERRRDCASGQARADLADRVMSLRRDDNRSVDAFDEGERIVTRSSGTFLVGPRLGAKFRDVQVTAEQQAKFDDFKRNAVARRERAREDGSPLALTVVGDQARVSVHGILTEAPDVYAWLFGEPNTLYSDIADAIIAAERNPSVRHVTFDIESGGGTVAGLRTATKAIAVMQKSRSVLSSFAASAAYWIASQIGRIEAKHDLAEFGSIGVAVRSVKHPIVHDIASTNAPNKRPDPSTEEGKAAIRRELDAIHAVFVGDVAAGRSRALACCLPTRHSTGG